MNRGYGRRWTSGKHLRPVRLAARRVFAPRQAVGGKARRGFKRADVKRGSSGAAEMRERKKAALRKEKTDE